MTSPQISIELSKIDNFSLYAQDFLSYEMPISAIKINAERIADMEFYKIEIRASVFENCTFQNCNFENAGFVDVIFQSCDFSNSKFAGAYFERCRFVCCKCVGVNMRDAVIKHTAFEESNFKYSFFDKAKLSEVLFDHTDLTEASIAEAKLKMFEARGTRFVKNNFFKTMLAAIDFTGNEFSMPIVSSPPVELKGAVVNTFQAADLIRIWGVIVKS